MGNDHSGHHGPSRAPDTHLASHFDNPRQQFTAGQLGMWLFIATEILMFGGLFCVYVVYRGNHPDIFEAGSRYLDRTWGFLNTLVLILSSLTMALAARAAQHNQQRQLVLFLTLTLICAVDFMAVKYIEYSHKFHEHLVWGEGFYRGEHVAVAHVEQELRPGDPTLGTELYLRTCAACHGNAGEGLDQLGPALANNEFAGSLDERNLLGFLKIGRPMDDPRNTTGLLMPPRGGNPLLSDQDLTDIIAHVRTLGREPVPTPRGGGPPIPPPEFAERERLPRSVVPDAAVPPSGLAPASGPEMRMASFLGIPAPPTELPPNTHIFFAIYFCMTGLHGIHVLVGIGVISWLRSRAVKGHFHSGYYTPVEFTGLYWHVVDIIWIFLFPLFYLI